MSIPRRIIEGPGLNRPGPWFNCLYPLKLFILCVILIGILPVVFASYTLYESHEIFDGMSQNFRVTRDCAQVFTVGVSGPNSSFDLTVASIYLGNVHGSPSEDVTLRIRLFNGTTIVPPDLCNSTLPRSSLSVNTWTDFPFSSCFINHSMQYALMVSTLQAGSAPSDSYYWAMDSYLDDHASYTGGAFYAGLRDVSMTIYTYAGFEFDGNFRLYGGSDDSSSGGDPPAGGGGGGNYSTFEETLESWNPSAYIALKGCLHNLFKETDLDSFFEDLWCIFTNLFKYIFQQPGSLVPEGGYYG